jgi:hypothetical protein
LKGLWGKLAEIQSSPESCRLREDLAKGCRSVRHEKHVIFFSIKGQALQVIRILHGAMDFNSHHSPAARRASRSSPESAHKGAHTATAVSWERGLRSPSGAAVRLLQIAKNRPKALLETAAHP